MAFKWINWYTMNIVRIFLTLVLLMAIDWSVDAAAISSLLQLFWFENPDPSPPDWNEIGAEWGYDVNNDCCAESFERIGFLRLAILFDDMIYFLFLTFYAFKVAESSFHFEITFVIQFQYKKKGNFWSAKYSMLVTFNIEKSFQNND